MPEITLPHEIVYEIEGRANLSDVIESLGGIDRIFREMIPLIETLAPGIKIDRITLSVDQISQNSPLREAVFAAILVAYQKDLEVEVPRMLEEIVGWRIGASYPAITSIIFLLVLFYGADFAYRRITKFLGRGSWHVRSRI